MIQRGESPGSGMAWTSALSFTFTLIWKVTAKRFPEVVAEEFLLVSYEMLGVFFPWV
jgi:hypothetical protein